MPKNPPRVVNDTNIWLSALFFAGKPAEIVRYVEGKQIVSITSNFILNELQEKMVNTFHTPLPLANVTISYIKSISQLVVVHGKNFKVRDPKDNPILETAVNGKCKWLITGDKDLLTLKNYKSIHIVTPAQFLNLHPLP